MRDKDNQQLELFKDVLDVAWNERGQLGRLYYDIYNLKVFVYDMKDENRKIKPVVKRDLKVKNKKITLKLRPQVVADDTEIKTRYLTEIDQNILDFILYKLSQDSYTMLNQKPYVVVSINEIRTKLKYDSKRIKQSLYMLNQYRVEFETKEYEGSIPNQLLDGIIIGKQGRDKKTLVKLSNGLMNYVYENKYLLMNYENMFELDRIGKIFYKRICISNYMELGETEKQKFVMNETICNLLEKYGITYHSKLQRNRLFKEVIKSLDLMKKNKILGHYELKPIYTKQTKEFKREYDSKNGKTEKNIKQEIEIATDMKIVMYLTKEFSDRFSAYQLNKNRLEREQAEKHLMKMKQELLGDDKKHHHFQQIVDTSVKNMAKE